MLGVCGSISGESSTGERGTGERRYPNVDRGRTRVLAKRLDLMDLWGGPKWKPGLAVECFFGNELERIHGIARGAHAITLLPAQSLAVFSFARSASTTSVGTNGETSPLRRATSLTKRELRKE